MNKVSFKKARPVWIKGLSEKMNITAGFRTVFKAGKGTYTLRITGTTIYRIWLNGKFMGHGPARCGHGWYRVDELDLPVGEGKNLLAIEAAGYNVNSYAYLDQPSFLQAEIVSGGKVRAATGYTSFKAYRLRERVQKVQRYSFQRAFVEQYKLSRNVFSWRTKLTFKRKPADIEVLKLRRLTERGVSLPLFPTKQPVMQVGCGTVKTKKAELPGSRYLVNIGPDFKGYPVKQLKSVLSQEYDSFSFSLEKHTLSAYGANEPAVLKQKRFQMYDFGCNLSGFIGMKVKCAVPVGLYLSFDELLSEEGDIDVNRLGCANIVKYDLKAGEYDLETIEPYTLRYLKLTARDGDCEVTGLYIREYVSPDAEQAQFAASDHHLSDLFEAARQTFRQNSVDIFMDCPSRERAGWLCDSFFTARTERDLCGKNPVERNFIENFLLPGKFPRLPKGMLPMCYPSDHWNDVFGTFIPNWAMWFVIELEEYLYRTGDRERVNGLKDKVYALVEYFEDFLNDDGLLENLEGWVFIEWSKANDFSQDVNYPSNMVYAGMLEAAGSLYSDQELLNRADQVRKEIRKQSYNGKYFIDNALRQEDGSLKATDNTTETSQYYAFFFDIADPETYAALWNRLLIAFGPNRDSETQSPDVYPSNAFIGFFLRLDILSRYGENSLILEQLRKNYLPMALKTGTLWENKDIRASCNHGFASYVVHILFRDILGIHFDPASKKVEFKIPAIPLDWCEGRIPVDNEWIEAKWYKEGETIFYSLSVPAGFQTEVINKSSFYLVTV